MSYQSEKNMLGSMMLLWIGFMSLLCLAFGFALVKCLSLWGPTGFYSGSLVINFLDYLFPIHYL